VNPPVLSIFGRAAASKATNPVGRALLRTGLTPNSVTIIGTLGSITAAVTLFPTDHLFWGAWAITAFVVFDMLDGAMARAQGGGTSFGAVLDASCDRIADGAIFGALAWWAIYTAESKPLLVATLIALVTSQVISYVKARAEASGLSANVGLIERPDRLVIVLVGAVLTGIGQHYEVNWLAQTIHPAMWILAIASVITVGQRLLEVRKGYLREQELVSAGGGQ
jgi:CDP-diacylglycerol--glycerol-3-phosphate 3-phosphatidyltransferase